MWTGHGSMSVCSAWIREWASSLLMVGMPAPYSERSFRCMKPQLTTSSPSRTGSFKYLCCPGLLWLASWTARPTMQAAQALFPFPKPTFPPTPRVKHQGAGECNMRKRCASNEKNVAAAKLFVRLIKKTC